MCDRGYRGEEWFGLILSQESAIQKLYHAARPAYMHVPLILRWIGRKLQSKKRMLKGIWSGSKSVQSADELIFVYGGILWGLQKFSTRIERGDFGGS